MPRFFKKILDVISNFVYKNMETTSGSMILLTSVVGITLSTLAQAGAILLNKNYSTSGELPLIFVTISEIAELPPIKQKAVRICPAIVGSAIMPIAQIRSKP